MPSCTRLAAPRCTVRTDRPELAKVLRRLHAGDVLMVTRLDRLARSTRDLLNRRPRACVSVALRP